MLLWCLSAAGCCCLQLVSAAHVYMEFNGQHYEYNTDGRASAHQLSPNYQQLDSQQHWPYTVGNPGAGNARRHQWGWTPPESVISASAAPTAAATSRPPSYNINLNTPLMTHTQHTDAAGHVLGKYSYYDAAGYHELSYKAGAGIGFVVMGGNLAKPTQQLQYE
ncbi:hypothetical protein KR093_008825 [Drosophila rubida]|uniref:Uncharacterized protein n=1 Tax=Drosophila rubida TaxID=30044 RepID=A0AAD4JWJ8_9MUSC|nr:hypothetical protein KR093_008825 [Drosophila rubida]